jgi:YbbR domain-containing protein
MLYVVLTVPTLNKAYLFIIYIYLFIYISLFVDHLLWNYQSLINIYVGGFSQGTPVSSTNKTDRDDITEILLKVALDTINYYKVKPKFMLDVILKSLNGVQLYH